MISDNKGLTILECILAIGIIAAVFLSIISLQSTIVAFMHDSSNRLGATWALRSTIAQINYALDAGGIDALPSLDVVPIGKNSKFSMTISKKPLYNLKPSQILKTALSFYNATNTNGNPNSNLDLILGNIAKIIDFPPATHNNTAENTAIKANNNSSIFNNIVIQISWNNITGQQKLVAGLVLIDGNGIANIQLPNQSKE